MGKSLLIGNGLNRCFNDEISADSIISKLEKEVLKTKGILNSSNKDFSLLFESIICNKDIEIVNVFNMIKDLLYPLNKLKNDLYVRYKKLILDFDSILTTNYDFSIEYNLFDDKSVETKALGKNKGYIYSKQDFKIYHIHGDLKHKENLCLGFYGYQKYLRSSISNLKQNISKYKKDKEPLEKVKKSLPESLQAFIENDIYIIGLNLYDSELLLWNILTIRKELIRLGIYKDFNKMYFFIPKEKDMDENKYKALETYYENFYIQLKIINPKLKENKIDYLNFYHQVFSLIEHKIK